MEKKNCTNGKWNTQLLQQIMTTTTLDIMLTPEGKMTCTTYHMLCFTQTAAHTTVTWWKVTRASCFGLPFSSLLPYSKTPVNKMHNMKSTPWKTIAFCFVPKKKGDILILHKTTSTHGVFTQRIYSRNQTPSLWREKSKTDKYERPFPLCKDGRVHYKELSLWKSRV